MSQAPADTQLNIRDHLQVRYVRLHFSLEILEDTELPINKASMLRGGMGEMLLRMNCIKDRNCQDCEFESECLVRRTMYSRMEITPEFMSSTDSVGYVLDCENYETQFHAGDIVEFTLLLLGKTIVYFSQFLQAFQYLGTYGVGKNHSHYRIVRLTSSKREPILDGNNIYMANLGVMRVSDYVDYRWNRAGAADEIRFYTPLTLKHRGEQVRHLDAEAILAACERRLYILNCFEGIDAGRIDCTEHVPTIKEHRVHERVVPRFSSTHAADGNGHMSWKGIVGSGDLSDVDDTARALLIAGELLHIGKNTSFGFGRYVLR